MEVKPLLIFGVDHVYVEYLNGREGCIKLSEIVCVEVDSVRQKKGTSQAKNPRATINLKSGDSLEVTMASWDRIKRCLTVRGMEDASWTT